MEQSIFFVGVLMGWRGIEKALVISDYYLPFGARVGIGIIMTVIDFVITMAIVDEDLDHCKKARQAAKKAKESFFQHVDGERVLSLHIVAIGIVSKLCLWSGLDYLRSFLIPILVFGVIFLEICTVSGDIQKYNQQKVIRGYKKGHIGVFVKIDDKEAKNVEKIYKTFAPNYAKILIACILFLRFTFYPYVNNCQDSWSMVNYLVLDLLLLFSVIKDYDDLNKKEKYTLVAGNLASLLIYMNLNVLKIIPFYLGVAYLMKKFRHKILCFVYIFILILLNQYLTWIYHHKILYQLHFASKMVSYGVALTFLLLIYKTDRRLLVFAKLFKSAVYFCTFLLILILFSELESNSYSSDFQIFKIKQEFAFLQLLLCLEMLLFIRFNLWLAQRKQNNGQIKKKDPYQSKEEEEKQKKKEKEERENSIMKRLVYKIMDITWRDDYIMKGQLKQISNFLVVCSVIILNMFFFNEKIILIIINYAFLNRWMYQIKGFNDAKLYFWHNLMYLFQYTSKYFLKKLYQILLVDIIGLFFPWKKNLLTNLALNFANIKLNINGRSTLLSEGDDFEVEYHDIKNHQLEVQNDDLENELVLTFLFTFIAFVCYIKRGREWKNRFLTIRQFLLPLWVYILLFEEYDFYINCMAFLQVVQTLDEQFIKVETF